jgi:hypothetical protein
VPDGARLLRIAVQEHESFTSVGWCGTGLLSVVRAAPEQALFADEGAFTFEQTSGYTDLTDIRTLLLDEPAWALDGISTLKIESWSTS